MPRILLVDDEKVARALYGDHLRAAGHSVDTAGGVAEARQALRDARYDVLVTDLILPDGDGLEILTHTREVHPGIEVVVITGVERVEPAVRAIKSGAAEYLIKPVPAEALQHAVFRALATRTLLRENASLRHHVELLETGQRVATALDRESLTSNASSAFCSAAGAEAIVLYARRDDEVPHVLGHSGVPVDSLTALTTAARSSLIPGDVPMPVRPLPGAFPEGLVVPATDADGTRGWALLLYGSPPGETWTGAAGFLGRHLALGLRNLGRFAEVEDLAYVDDLTHLFNTRYLHLVLDREVPLASQTGQPFSVLFLDLDYFKSVNDTYGHLVGSALLVEVGKVLKGLVRDHDIVARYGGDEYVIILKGTDSGGALKVAERIRMTIEGHHFLSREGMRLSITTCIGVASFPEHANEKLTLLDWADRAMYRGKKGSRNIVYMAASGLEATPSERQSRPTG